MELILPCYFFIWTPDIEEHVAGHGVAREEFERIVQSPDSVEKSRSSDRMIAFGEADDGRLVACVYEAIDEDSIEPVTAYFLED